MYWVEWCLSKIHVYLEPMNVKYITKLRPVIGLVIKLNMTGILIRKKDKQCRRQCEYGSRYWNDASLS